MRWILILILASLKIDFHNLLHRPYLGYVTVPASDKYCSPSFLERILCGSNYRMEWETPVRMPVFDFRKTNFKIIGIGGGQQTTSLDLVDKSGREWVLRSVDKNVKPSNAIMKNTFIQTIIQDHVSASYPYAGLSVPDIANAAGVPAGEQSLYFVPDDSAFGQYRSIMADKVFILVNNQPGSQKGITTDEMMNKLKFGKQYYIDQREYLNARLVDWLIADWDRHDDQWRWMERKTDTGIALYVVPRDRDQAFFQSNGLLAAFIGLFFMPHINKFNKSGRGIKGLSNKTRSLDRLFTSELTKDDWKQIIKEFQNNITDNVIESAIRKQPPEIFAIRGNELVEKLKSRRDGLFKHVMKYYDFLKKE